MAESFLLNSSLDAGGDGDGWGWKLGISLPFPGPMALSRVALTARGEVPPAGDGDALRLARAGVILQPATGRLHGPPIDTRVEETVLVEEAGADLAVALGKDATLAGDEAAELLGLPEAFHLPTSRAAVTAAHPAEGVPLCPALDEVGDTECWHATCGHQVILGVAVVAATEAVGQVLEAAWDGDGEEGLPVVHHLQPKVGLDHDVEAKGEDVHFTLAQLQGQVEPLVVDLRGRKGGGW